MKILRSAQSAIAQHIAPAPPKTLKTEEINGKEFADIKDARRHINGFIEEVYNTVRLHSALSYQSPLEFKTAFTQNKTLKTTRQPHCHRI